MHDISFLHCLIWHGNGWDEVQKSVSFGLKQIASLAGYNFHVARVAVQVGCTSVVGKDHAATGRRHGCIYGCLLPPNGRDRQAKTPHTFAPSQPGLKHNLCWNIHLTPFYHNQTELCIISEGQIEFLSWLAAEVGLPPLEEWRVRLYRTVEQCVSSHVDGYRDALDAEYWIQQWQPSRQRFVPSLSWSSAASVS